MKCPTCKKLAQPKPLNTYAPFCSDRCRMADLNQWLNGSYAIPGQPVDVSEMMPSQRDEDLDK
jgi:uncharacterized protein